VVFATQTWAARTERLPGGVGAGVTVIKGSARLHRQRPAPSAAPGSPARLTGPGAAEIDGRALTAEHILIATGSAALIPPIKRLTEVPVWTNREITTLTEIPRRALLVGGSSLDR